MSSTVFGNKEMRHPSGWHCPTPVPLTPFRRFLRWREHDEHNANDNERRYVPEQMSAFTRMLERLHRHNGGVNEA